MKSDKLLFSKIGFLLCATSVTLGAVGSHLLKEFLSPENLLLYEKGTRYMFIHSVAITFLPFVSRKLNEKPLEVAIYLFLGGIVFFSGGLFLYATRELWATEDEIWPSALTPVGGFSFISAWLLLFFRGIKGDDEYAAPESKTSYRKHRHKHRNSHSSHAEPESSSSSGENQ